MTLTAASTPSDLRVWLDGWATKYPVVTDDQVMVIANSGAGSLGASDLRKIFQWKLQANHFVTADDSLIRFEKSNPGKIESRTMAALAAEGDAEALAALRGLPQMKTSGTVAVASCLLMCLDPERWTVIDRRAINSIALLKDIFRTLPGVHGALFKLMALLEKFDPPTDETGRFLARAIDWPLYMDICREIQRLTGLTLRDIDRGLYEANGNN